MSLSPTPRFASLDLDDEFLAVAAAAVNSVQYFMKYVNANEESRPGRTAGSAKGKARNRNRRREEKEVRIDLDYFCRVHRSWAPMFSDEEFELRFRVSHRIYEDIQKALLAWRDLHFVKGFDAAGVRGASTDKKMLSAMCAIVYGASADQLVEIIRLAESTNLKCLKMFYRAMVEIFGEEWIYSTNILPSLVDVVESRFRTLQSSLTAKVQAGGPGPVGWLVAGQSGFHVTRAAPSL
jgi:hypothetical protein